MEIYSVYNTRIFEGIFVDYIHRSQSDQMIFKDDKKNCVVKKNLVKQMINFQPVS